MHEPSLAAQLGTVLQQRALTFCAAESCTGGLVLDHMTDIPGSSAYVLGGVVAYANVIKRALLGVREETLLTYGAVSEQTAEEMVRGVQAAFGADVAVSVTGIAGPGGGTADKPVGLTYIGCLVGDQLVVQRHVWTGDRTANKRSSADAALALALAQLGTGAP